MTIPPQSSSTFPTSSSPRRPNEMSCPTSEFRRGPTSAIGRGPTSAIGRGPKSAIGRGPTSAIGRGPKSAIGRGPTSAIGRGPTSAMTMSDIGVRTEIPELMSTFGPVTASAQVQAPDLRRRTKCRRPIFGLVFRGFPPSDHPSGCRKLFFWPKQVNYHDV
ncbi:unnamed protein product [Linum tenue]|uniref:Uncharacterized protein n=1 Tax=Linum tenue TaxID=586396 RepID=A0AAV0R1T2_9ROSI|nr:unnamed protein product [Linum tenue]